MAHITRYSWMNFSQTVQIPCLHQTHAQVLVPLVSSLLSWWVPLFLWQGQQQMVLQLEQQL